MAKKSSGKTYVSKGERNSVSNATRAAMRAARPGWEKLMNIHDAWVKGQNPWITLPNSDKKATNRQFVKVRYAELMGGSFKELEKKNYMV